MAEQKLTKAQQVLIDKVKAGWTLCWVQIYGYWFLRRDGEKNQRVNQRMVIKLMPLFKRTNAGAGTQYTTHELISTE